MRHYLCFFLIFTFTMLLSGCSAGNSGDAPTSEDSVRYERAREFMRHDSLEQAALEYDSFLATPRQHTSRMDMAAINDLAWCRLCNKEQEEAMRLVLKGDSIAHATQDEFMQATFRFANGRYVVEDNEKIGLAYMREGIDLMKQFLRKTTNEQDRHKSAIKLISYYENLLWAMPEDSTAQKRQLTDEMEAFMNDCLAQKFITQQDYENSLYQLYSEKLYLLIEEGELQKAEETFQLCQQTKTAKTERGKANLPFMLISLGHHEEAIGLLEKEHQKYLESADTLELNENYRALIYYMSLCYDSLHQEAKALHFKNEYERISNAITIHHANQDIAHLGTLYEVQQRQYQVEEEHQRSLRTTTISIALGILLLIAFAAFAYTRHVNHIIRRKNAVLAKHINSLLDENRHATGTAAATDQQDTEENDAPDEISVAMIQRFKHVVVARKLFCNTDFDRDALLTELQIPHRTFAQQFEACTGTTVAQYILTTRLEFAAELIRNHPDYTVDGIARQSGFSGRSTFYRNFTRQFGITPTEYRAQCLS